MTRGKIIETIKDNLQYECYNGFGISEYSINTAEIYDKADTLLAIIEQEKKATIKLILLGFQCALDEKQPERAVEETILRIAERYGVEL